MPDGLRRPPRSEIAPPAEENTEGSLDAADKPMDWVLDPAAALHESDARAQVAETRAQIQIADRSKAAELLDRLRSSRAFDASTQTRPEAQPVLEVPADFIPNSTPAEALTSEELAGLKRKEPTRFSKSELEQATSHVETQLGLEINRLQAELEAGAAKLSPVEIEKLQEEIQDLRNKLLVPDSSGRTQAEVSGERLMFARRNEKAKDAAMDAKLKLQENPDDDVTRGTEAA